MSDDATMSPQALTGRVDDLEVRAAYQDQMIEDLNKVVLDQWTALEKMGRRMAALEDRLRDVQASVGADGQDEPPPPHY